MASTHTDRCSYFFGFINYQVLLAPVEEMKYHPSLFVLIHSTPGLCLWRWMTWMSTAPSLGRMSKNVQKSNQCNCVGHKWLMSRLKLLQFEETYHVSEIVRYTLICHISDHFTFWSDPAWIISTYALSVILTNGVSYSQCFQTDVSSHQPLTSSVLHTGQVLLDCINTTSPCPCVRKKKPSIFPHFHTQLL